MDRVPKIFDFTLATQTKDTDKNNKVYNYFWKVFDFRGNKTMDQVLDNHPYCKDPIKSLSK